MPTYQPKFSVLIPAVPSRMAQLQTLMAKLQWQIVDGGFAGQAEVVALLDNKARSVGLKRQALLDAARGTWLAFVDDDDDVADDYIHRIMLAIGGAGGAEVIAFDTLCYLNGGPGVLVNHGVANDNEEYNPAGFKRKPWQMHPWHKDLARSCRFPDCSYGEDAAWLEQLWNKQVFEVRSEGPPLYHYRFSTQGTEAEHTFPPKEGLTNRAEGEE